MQIEIITALVTGLVGSLHCLGMCGPLMMAIPFQSGTLSPLLNVLLYHSGRISAYALLGFVFGIFGHTIQLMGFQQILSIGSGVMVILFVLFSIKSKFNIVPGFVSGFIKRKIVYFIQHKSIPSLIMMGFLNGLLPCGMVYIAILGAIATGNAAESSIYMLMFGTGTIPLMAAISIGVNQRWFRKIKEMKMVIPAVSILIGLILILRGLELNIPLISPGEKAVHGSCCHQ